MHVPLRSAHVHAHVHVHVHVHEVNQNKRERDGGKAQSLGAISLLACRVSRSKLSKLSNVSQ